MPSGGLLPSARVAILGLGLMGGSLAIALRGRCAGVLGSDPDPGTLELAQQWEIVDQASADPVEILPKSDLVVLAAPVRAILSLLQSLPDLHPGEATVLDLGSTKVKVVAAMERLPSRFDPIGGHPMCGKETYSLRNAEAGLYRGAAFAFTPLERSTEKARALAGEIAAAVGAHPLFLDPGVHDRWVAATSHLPYLLAAALALATPVEASALVGPGFRSTARLAASSPSVMLDVLATNRENVLASLQAFRRQLDVLESGLVGGASPGLASSLERGGARLAELVEPRPGGDR
jgi:prephenate dehydrogenase